MTGPDSNLFTNVSTSDTFSIAPGGQPDTITIQFSPVSLDTNHATLHIYNNDFFNNPVDINLSGHGVAPDIWVFPTSLSFGKVLVSEDSVLTLSVRNNGTSRLEIDSTKIIGTNAGQFLFAGGQGSFFLDPDDIPHNISIQFLPTNTGIKNATMRIYCNDQDEETVDIPLQGEA